MRYNKKFDRVFATVSWLIVIALLYSATSLWINPPSGVGPIASAAGILASQIFYTALYAGEAGFLAYSKAFKRKKMRKNTLMVIYLTGFFTSLLTLFIVGWVPGLIDNVLISLSAAFCWLYWTFKTEYIDPAAYNDAVWQLRDDTPNP